MPVPATLADPAVSALLEAARRASRGGAPRTVLLLHLNAIAAPRPHHGRIARAILTNVAHRLEGEVLRLQCGDLALLCRHRVDPDPTGPDASGAEGLPEVLTRLFGATAPDAARLFSVWHLPGDAITLHAHLIQSRGPVVEAVVGRVAGNPLGAIAHLLDFSVLPELMQRQTAVRLRAGDAARALEACFREVTFSIDALERRVAAGGQAQADPFVFRHLTARLDMRILTVLARQLETGGPLVTLNAAQPDAARLHINLALTGILSPQFDRLAQVAQERGVRLGVELAYVEACAQPIAFAAARNRLREAKVALVLDGVSAAALQITRPGALDPDLVKLEWTPELPRLAGLPRGRLQEGLRACGVERVVLHRAENEAALAWGLAQGITLFQGRHVDAMLSARRMQICGDAVACTLRQCIDRAASVGAGGREGCRDTSLLDGRVVVPPGPRAGAMQRAARA